MAEDVVSDMNDKRDCKKSPQEKRLRSCQKARQQSFFVV